MEITSTTTVERPADEVFATIADFSRNPEWQGGMRSCRWITDPPLRVGSRYEQEAVMLGRPVRSTFAVTAYEPGRSVRIESIESTFPIQVTRSVEPVSEGTTRVTAVVSGGPGGLAKLLDPVMRWLVKRSVDGDYARLKAMLES